ncbi:MAG: symmetrical bis(5'-nucleosyl)-tetraphosphatase [Desulfurivibrionaceae bacterium]
MAVYAIGDVQGCFDELSLLLRRIDFRPGTDILWFAGDLVNRGAKSLATLRFIRDLGERAVVVLGNHDLHLLAVAAGIRPLKASDTFQDILEAPDRDDLLAWLRSHPLLYHDRDRGYTLVHAGIPPQWEAGEAERRAGELEDTLHSPSYVDFLRSWYEEREIDKNLDPELKRLTYTANCLTRLRFCDLRGNLADCTGPPGSQPETYYPWFQVPGRAAGDMRIICGHWAALSYHEGDNIYALDTGCVWGGGLTALRLDPKPVKTTVPCPGK